MHAVRKIAMSVTAAAALGACAGGGVTPVSAGVNDASRLDRALQSIVDHPVHGMASLSVLALRDGRVSFEGQYGLRRVGEGAAPADRATMYRIASVSKLVTTIGVMKLVEQGKLALDADASGYLGFKLRNPAYPNSPITLRMLLSRTSSLRDNAGYSWSAEVALRDVFGQSGAIWASVARPGRHFAYSNLNWGVVGTIMEAVTGERFDLLMRRLVLEPLGMRGGYNVAAFTVEEWSDVATLYRKRAGEGSPWQPDGPWFAQVDNSAAPAPQVPGLGEYVAGRNGTLFSPTGGLRISAADLGIVMRMLLDGGRHGGTTFLQAASVGAMLSRQWTYDAAAANGDTGDGLYAAWGLGVQHFEHGAGQRSSLVEGGGFRASGHLGDAHGLRAVFALDVASRSGMVVLIGGTVSDPASTPGRYSALSRQEELIVSALYRHAILPAP